MSKVTPEMVALAEEALYEMSRRIALFGEVGVDTKAHGGALSAILSEWRERGDEITGLHSRIDEHPSS